MERVTGDRPGTRPGVVAYVGLVSVGAFIGEFLCWRRWGAPSVPVVLFFWGLHVFAESSALVMPNWTVSAGFLVLMTAAFSATPSTAWAIGFLSAMSWLEFSKRGEPIRITFNAAQGALYTASASVIFAAVRSHGNGPLVVILATALAAVVAFVLNAGLTAGVLAVHGGRRMRKAGLDFLWLAPNYLGFSFAGLLVASTYRHVGPLAAIFLVTPLLVLRLAHKGYRDLEIAQRRTLEAFVTAVELKDEYTQGHSTRVAQVAIALFEELGSDESQIRQQYYGALLHDLGKVAIPGRILAKAGALTASEYEVVKRHPVIGAAIASEVEFLAGQVPQILFHHERVDGLGYPWGLKGDAIPFEARVLAVADAFDALTWGRHYREPLSERNALAELKRCVGTQLDGVPVVALERLLDRGTVFVHQLPTTFEITQSARSHDTAVSA